MEKIDLFLEEKKFLSVVDEVVRNKKGELTDEDIKKVLIAHQHYTEKIILKGYENFIKNYEKYLYNKTKQDVIITEY